MDFELFELNDVPLHRAIYGKNYLWIAHDGTIPFLNVTLMELLQKYFLERVRGFFQSAGAQPRAECVSCQYLVL